MMFSDVSLFSCEIYEVMGAGICIGPAFEIDRIGHASLLTWLFVIACVHAPLYRGLSGSFAVGYSMYIKRERHN